MRVMINSHRHSPASVQVIAALNALPDTSVFVTHHATAAAGRFGMTAGRLIDAYHETAICKPVRTDVATIYTIDSLDWLETPARYPKADVRRWDRALPVALECSDVIICTDRCVLEKLIDRLGVDRARIVGSGFESDPAVDPHSFPGPYPPAQTARRLRHAYQLAMTRFNERLQRNERSTAARFTPFG